jgi:hypothetical protein
MFDRSTRRSELRSRDLKGRPRTRMSSTETKKGQSLPGTVPQYMEVDRRWVGAVRKIRWRTSREAGCWSEPSRRSWPNRMRTLARNTPAEQGGVVRCDRVSRRLGGGVPSGSSRGVGIPHLIQGDGTGQGPASAQPHQEQPLQAFGLAGFLRIDHAGSTPFNSPPYRKWTLHTIWLRGQGSNLRRVRKQRTALPAELPRN